MKFIKADSLMLARKTFLHKTNMFPKGSDISAATRYNPRILNLSITSRTGSSILDAALAHVTLVIEHCTQLNYNSKDKVGVLWSIYLPILR